MASLYIVTPGAEARVAGNRLVVVKDEDVLGSAPLDRVSELVLVGRVGVSTPALHALLGRGADVLLLARSGRPLGRLSAPMGKNHPLRRAQYARASDGEFCVSFARAIATAKVGNSISLARRWSRQLHEDGVEPAPNILASAIACYARLATARDLNELRGLEGAAGCQYYRVLRMMLRPCWSFERRTRRPPADPVNALLSICYTLLTQAAVSALEVVGLDPFEGFYHGDKYGRPALALDLVEEFRAYVADSLTLRLINRRMVELRDFGTRAGGVILSPRGWSVVLTQFGRRMNEEILVRDIDRRLSVRKIIEFQARRIARVVQGKDEHYKPFRTR